MFFKSRTAYLNAAYFPIVINNSKHFFKSLKFECALEQTENSATENS